MKMTKQINIVNVYGEKITIKPVEYIQALDLVIYGEENSLLMDRITSLVLKLYNQGVENPKENVTVKELLKKHDDKKKEIDSIREKLNYWYCGIDNLDIEDIKVVERKYKRRRTLKAI